MVALFYNKAEMAFCYSHNLMQTFREIACGSSFVYGNYWLLFQYFLSNNLRKSSYVQFCSDEENDEDLDSIYYLPVAPEVDDPEETGWTQEVC